MGGGGKDQMLSLIIGPSPLALPAKVGCRDGFMCETFHTDDCLYGPRGLSGPQGLSPDLQQDLDQDLSLFGS